MDFDELFKFLFHRDSIIVMRAADVLEKITVSHPDYLKSHKKELMSLFKTAINKELKWHLEMVIVRLSLTRKEFLIAWDSFANWAVTKGDSKLVRVAAIQGLYQLTKHKPDMAIQFDLICAEIEREGIPSVNARIRNIRKEMAGK